MTSRSMAAFAANLSLSALPLLWIAGEESLPYGLLTDLRLVDVSRLTSGSIDSLGVTEENGTT